MMRINSKMMRINSVTVFLFSFCLLYSASAPAQNSERPVKMKELPKAVQKTVREQSKGATVRGLAKEVEDGNTFYEVELSINGRTKDVLIDPAGAVVTIEEEIPLASVPDAVKAELEKHAAGGKIVMVESISKNDAVIAYEAHIKIGDKALEVKVGPDGQLISSESDEDEDKEHKGAQKRKKDGR